MLHKNPVKQIKKRDGRIMTFDRKKVISAIFKALRSVGQEDQKLAEKLTKQVVKILNKEYDGHIVPTVEQVQDITEKVLIKENLAEVAKSYILYREQHAKIRDLNKFINSDDLIDQYLGKLDWRVKENSNMAYSLQGLNNHVASTISAHYWLNSIYSSEIREAHMAADLHLHDLQLLAAYCCGWDLRDLLIYGFTGVEGKVQSKPPKHFRSALGMVVNFLYTLQGEANGAQAFSSFDTYLAPFIRYDKLDYPAVKQSMQEFMFNMNIPTRVGFQTPFTNITMDIKPSGALAEDFVIIGGEVTNDKYKDFQPEMDMINKAFAEVCLEGDAKGRVFTFPIPTYNITKETEWNNPILEKVWEMTAKYGIPYFSNFVNSDMSPDDARSMCCRLRLDNRELKKRGGGLFGANPLTGSIGVVTLNLPRIGYLAKTKEEYFAHLDRLMRIARESLETKREVLEKFTNMGLYPYSRFYLKKIKEQFGEYWKNHFNTIGILGMNESLLNFMGKNITTEEGHAFAIEVMDHMRDKLMTYQQETGHLYNLEATPGEGTTYRFAKADKKKYADIVVANEQDYRAKGAAPYYTNSTQLPVNYSDDIFEALDLQDDLQTKYTGGTVLHGFIGEKMPSAQATKELVKKIAENYHLPYYTITPTFSICPVHGYIAGEHYFCPRCDEEIGYTEVKAEAEVGPAEQTKLFDV
ncbi:MAG TPA: ribonucleoside triphosphate reductase [Patescibacteria group bacterium]|nr:ribonucleoside triphosphate reductase [Patescibacteria group bacterium]